jgi:hypothetical protein
MPMNKQIGIINNKVIRLLNLDYDDELPIYIGEDNIKHMQKEHLEDYNKYRRQNTRYFK